MEIIKGTEITEVHPHYEQIYVQTATNGKGFFISSEDLVTILSEFDFNVLKKRTRRWGNVEIDNWKVEEINEPRG